MDREFFAGSDVCFVQSDGLNKPVKRHGKQSRKWRLVREIMITDPAFIAGTPDVFVYGGRTVFRRVRTGSALDTALGVHQIST